MNKLLTTTLFCASALLLGACGGGPSKSDKGDEDKDIKLTAIPKSMVSAICFDSNGNKGCDKSELLEYRYDFGGASIYQADKKYPSSTPILVEIGDPIKVNHFEKMMLSFSGDSKELSMSDIFCKIEGIKGKFLTESQKQFKQPNYFCKIEGIDGESNPIKTPEDDRDFSLAYIANMNLLGQSGLSKDNASKKSLEKIIKVISTLSKEEIKALSAEKDKNWIEILSFNKEEVYEIAKESRGKEKGLVNDKLVESFKCKAGQVRTVQHYGVEDVFSLANGVEQAYPSSDVTNWPSIIAYNNNVNQPSTSSYDETHNDRIFADNIKNLPAGIVSGRIYIGLKSNGSSLQHNDTINIGKYGANSLHYVEALSKLKLADGTGTQPYFTKWQNQLVSSTNPTTDVLWNDFNRVKFTTNSSLLNYVQTTNHFDVVVQDDTSVDFITVATCSKKEPIVEITPILEKFQCKSAPGPDNETRVTLVGGTVDAFAAATDNSATPSSALVNAAATGYPPGTTGYDTQTYDKALIDTLTLPTGGYISSARLSIGVKALNSSLHNNDRVYLGYGGSNSAAFDLYGSSSNSVNSLWNITSISNGERILQTNFTGSNANSLAWLRNQSDFDLLIQDDTSVDFVQLDLCMREKPPFVDSDNDGYSDDEESEAGSDPQNPDSTPADIDGDGVPNGEDCDPYNPDIWENCKPILPKSCDKEINVDLRPAISWKDVLTGNSPTENNVFSTYPPHPSWANVIWDGAMNWFDFGSASNTEHDLKIDFCSCGGGDAKVTEMKSDNYSWVYLDSATPSNMIVERMVHSQATMASWGTSVSGSKSFPYSGNGIDHSLNFKVKNFSGPSGGSINGQLSFTGHLGKCTSADTLPK